MSGCHEIDVMTAHFLKVKHHVRQILVLNLLSFALVRNGPVLTEDTAEVAVGEEDGARPLSAHQGHLLPKMGMITENHRLERSPTESLDTLVPIHAALPWAELAILEEGIGLLNPLSQFTLHLQFLIGWNPICILPLSRKTGNGREKKRTPYQERTSNEISAREVHKTCPIIVIILRILRSGVNPSTPLPKGQDLSFNKPFGHELRAKDPECSRRAQG